MKRGRHAHARNWNPDHRRPWRDPVLGHRQILSRRAAIATTQAAGRSGLLGIDRKSGASTGWLSVPSLGARTIFAGPVANFLKLTGWL